MKNKKKIEALIGVLAVITVAGFGTALAQQGMQGMQHGQMGPGGQGWGSNWQGWSRGWGGKMGHMSPQDMQKVQQLHNDFLRDTEGLRRDLFNKDLELRNELGKQNPDNGRVAQLQQEISQMETKLYRIRDQYMLKMQKINPNMGRGMMKPGGSQGMMMQPGSGQGMMMPGGGQGVMQPSN